jgi:hypothetical protein
MKFRQWKLSDRENCLCWSDMMAGIHPNMKFWRKEKEAVTSSSSLLSQPLCQLASLVMLIHLFLFSQFLPERYKLKLDTLFLQNCFPSQN